MWIDGTRYHNQDAVLDTPLGQKEPDINANKCAETLFLVFRQPKWEHDMPTYVYETIPKSEQEAPEQFEVFQKVTDELLTKHPETGVPIRRIISGGILIGSKKSGGDCCDSKCSCG